MYQVIFVTISGYKGASDVLAVTREVFEYAGSFYLAANPL